MKYYYRKKNTTRQPGYLPGKFTYFYVDCTPKEMKPNKSANIILKSGTGCKPAS